MKVIKLLAVIFVAAIGIGVIMINIIKFLSSLKNTKSSLYKEINKVRKRSEEMVRNLIPLTAEEISELSYQILPNKNIKGIKSKTITTIFNEPLISYASRLDKSSGRGYAVYLTNAKEFSFIHLPDTIEVFVDEIPLGRIKKDGSLRDANNKVMAYTSEIGNYKTIVVNDKEIAKLNKHKSANVLERVYELKTGLNSVEAEILFAMTLPEFTKNFSSN